MIYGGDEDPTVLTLTDLASVVSDHLQWVKIVVAPGAKYVKIWSSTLVKCDLTEVPVETIHSCHLVDCELPEGGQLPPDNYATKDGVRVA